ncbi:MAG: hypothetical protein Pars2KO_07670 [Parasphingorhabdus sp.]
MFMRILDGHELDELISWRLPRDCFGPESDWPYLALDLGTVTCDHSIWLKSLACPVIGIGNGQLAESCDVLIDDSAQLGPITRNIERAPLASMVLVQHLRASQTLAVEDALTAESFAYATLQQGPEFQSWLEGREKKQTKNAVSNPVVITSDQQTLHISLNDPENHNAIGTAMRDALCEALDLAFADFSVKEVHLSASGRTFSTGGDVDEFGEVSDPATAHWVRSLRLPAWHCARISEKLHVHIQGAAIGAGLEIAAFGTHVTATSDAWFQLPELKYGLIPGAGGTASLPRRIGRQRTAFLALSMKKINAQTALEWGLVDDIVS